MASALDDLGRRFIYGHEGCPLTAYRDPVGIWTIGPGLTAATGAISPRAGMTITQQEADRIFNRVMEATYIPAAMRALGSVSLPQNVVNGASSFTFNCGPAAVARASWVTSWKNGVWPEVKRRLSLWNKGGGRELPGLTRRRKEEGDLIVDGRYPSWLSAPAPVEQLSLYAVWVVQHDDAQVAGLRADLLTLGYTPGDVPGKILAEAVREFQKDRGITVDAKIGPATLATVQRAIERKRQDKIATGGGLAAGSTGAAGGGAGADSVPGAEVIDIVAGASIWGVGTAVAVVALVIIIGVVYRYRGAIFGTPKVTATNGG